MSSKGRKGERKSAKKSEESTPLEEKKECPIPDPTPVEQASEAAQIEEPPKEPTPEPVYDEPVLSELIIEVFEGEKVRGLYSGEGTASFKGGNEYRGQFSEGLMHGRGKYTWKHGLSYEGDFDKNHITGKGCYLWPDGSSYEGEVCDGKRQGYGTFRCVGNKMLYTGNWTNGKRNGKGRMEYDDEGKSYYDGDWVNNIRHGYGTRQYPSGNIYQGMWFNNVRHGDGTMKWLDRDQIYTGQWENGIQHGMGQHIWLLPRIAGSQYPLRNMYDGEFVGGLRHGQGSFYYASGAKYEGGWKNNMKHGSGKFTFKNGRIYEGIFEKDHIVEFPDFSMDGTNTPDISMLRTRTPLAHEAASVHSNSSKNTVGPSFQLEIDHLLVMLPDSDRDEELNQVLCVITRYITGLKKIYTFYSGLGHEESLDNTFIMNKMQFWRFLKDCRLHDTGVSLTEMDRLTGGEKRPSELHNPYERILQRQFINNLVTLAYHIYADEHDGSIPILGWCLSKLICDKVLQHACKVKGHFYYETRRAINALVHLDQAYDVYQKLALPRKFKPKEPVIKMRQFLHMINDFKLINEDLTAKVVIGVLKSDDPNVADDDGCCNLELEMTFLEFFEALIGCAEIFVTEKVVKDPTTPRPSTALTVEQMMYSMPASPSREANSRMEDNLELQSSPQKENTPDNSSSIGRGISATEVKGEAQISASGSDIARQGDSHQGSAKQGRDLGAISEQQSSPLPSSQAALEDNHLIMQSSASITAGDKDDTLTAADEDEEEELDEATRLFNFWTHQVHIFFVRKLFPAADKMIEIQNRIKKILLEESRSKLFLVQSPSPNITEVA